MPGRSENWIRGWWLAFNGPNFRAFMGGIAAVVGDKGEAIARQAVRESLPALAEDETSLGLIGADVGIERGPTETVASYRERLAHHVTLNRVRGTHAGLLLALKAADLGEAILVQVNGRAETLSGAAIDYSTPGSTVEITDLWPNPWVAASTDGRPYLPTDAAPWWAFDDSMDADGNQFTSRFAIVYLQPDAPDLGVAANLARLRRVVRDWRPGAKLCVGVYVGLETAGFALGGLGPFDLAGAHISTSPTQLVRLGHLDVAIDGLGTQTLVVDGVQGYNAGFGGTFLGVAGSFVVRFDEDVATNTTVTFDGSEVGAAAAVAKVQTAVSAHGKAINNSGQLAILSKRFGTSTNVRIVSGGAPLLADLGLSVGLGTAGDANFGGQQLTIAFMDACTATEAAAALNFYAGSGITGATASVDSDTSLLRIDSNTIGTAGSIEILVSSTLLFGFTAGVYPGAAGRLWDWPQRPWDDADPWGGPVTFYSV